MKATDLITRKEAVKSASIIDSVISGGVGSLADNTVKGVLPNAPAWAVGAGEIAAGIFAGPVIGKIAGNTPGVIAQNGLVTVGSLNLFNAGWEFVSSMLNTTKAAATTSNTSAGTMY